MSLAAITNPGVWVCAGLVAVALAVAAAYAVIELWGGRR